MYSVCGDHRCVIGHSVTEPHSSLTGLLMCGVNPNLSVGLSTYSLSLVNAPLRKLSCPAYELAMLSESHVIFQGFDVGQR